MLKKVKSNFILKKIFANIKKKRKLNIIKYNKKMTQRLKIFNDDFKIFKIL